MNVQETPMILFTVISQMCVGAFVVLGIVQVLASRHYDDDTVERVTHPVLYALGPAMILGLAVSSLHMGYPLHAINVLRHWNSSWLSREIIFGVGFAGLGFLFALLEWFHVGSFKLRRALAVVTALVGIGLVVSEFMIYYSVQTIPAWHTWEVPAAFVATTLLMGALCVSGALMVTTMVRNARQKKATRPAAAHDETGSTEEVGSTVEAASGAGAASRSTNSALATMVRERVSEINAPTTSADWALTTQVIRGCTVLAAVVAALTLAGYPLYVSTLSNGVAAARAVVPAYSGAVFVIRLVLLAVLVILLGFFVYRTAGTAVKEHPTLLAWIVIGAFILAFVGELLGRSMHYSGLVHVGI